MAFPQFLDNLLGGAVHAVNNDVVHPAMNAVHQLLGSQSQTSNVTSAPMQHVNLVQGGANFGAPQIQQYQGNQARLNAQKQLGFTPAFAQNLFNAQPYVGRPIATSALSNRNGAGAEYLGPQSLNQIVLGQSRDPSSVLHEGLHRIYQTNPQVRQQFAQAYNQSVTPAIKNYLTMRLYPYAGFAKGLDEGGVPIPNYDLSNISNLPVNLQNEAHSFLSELPSNEFPLPPRLNSYYSRYFNPATATASGIAARRVR